MELSTEVTERSAFPLGRVARCCAHWRCIVTDEVRPPSVGVTAARTFAILWLAAVAASAPSEGFGFRAPPVADTARKASRCRPQVRERIAEARAENGEGAKLSSLSGLRGLD